MYVYIYIYFFFKVKALGEDNPFTQLVVDLTGIDPDDTFSSVVYEKGHTFLFYLEQLLGGPGMTVLIRYVYSQILLI